jgi:hypothetical protein
MSDLLPTDQNSCPVWRDELNQSRASSLSEWKPDR